MSELPGGLIKRHMAVPTLGTSDSTDQGWGLRICILLSSPVVLKSRDPTMRITAINRITNTNYQRRANGDSATLGGWGEVGWDLRGKSWWLMKWSDPVGLWKYMKPASEREGALPSDSSQDPVAKARLQLEPHNYFLKMSDFCFRLPLGTVTPLQANLTCRKT